MSSAAASTAPPGPRANGSHDIGGAAELGPVPVDRDGPAFEEPWEGVVMALSLGAVVGGVFAVDQHRAAVGGIHPALYMSTEYFEQWLYALERCLVAAGKLEADEIEARVTAVAEDPDLDLPSGENEELETRMRMLLAHGIPEAQLDREPAFAPGDEVTTRVIRTDPGRGHTRMPAYAQAKRGVVGAVYPPQPLADAIVAGEGMRLEYVYSVRFSARDLWPDAEPGNTVGVDLWETYMEPAGEGSAANEQEEG